MHSRHIRLQAGGIGHSHHFDHGFGAIDEFYQHAGIHIASARLVLILVWRGIEIERIVLALARRDNIKAQRLRETDDLDGGGWFVTRRARIDHASLMRLLTQIAANGDIGLDIQHNDMLAMFHGLKRDERADIGVAGGINDDIDMGGAAQRFKVTGEGDLSSLNRGINGNAAVGFNNIGAPAPCHQHRVNGRFMPHFRNGPQPHPRHQ